MFNLSVMSFGMSRISQRLNHPPGSDVSKFSNPGSEKVNSKKFELKSHSAVLTLQRATSEATGRDERFGKWSVNENGPTVVNIVTELNAERHRKGTKDKGERYVEGSS